MDAGFYHNAAEPEASWDAVPERFPQSGERLGASAFSSASAASGSCPDNPTKNPEFPFADFGFFI